GAAFLETHGLADAIAEEVQLGAADDAGALDLDLGDPRRVERELALDPLPLHDAADGERLTQARAGAGDHHAVEYLDALFLAFENSRVHVHRVADGEVLDLRFEATLFDEGQCLLTHVLSLYR